MRTLTMQVIPQVYQITFRHVNIFLIVEENLTLIDTGFVEIRRVCSISSTHWEGHRKILNLLS